MLQHHHLRRVQIDTVHLHLCDIDFIRGYNTGYRTFHAHHVQGDSIDIAHLFFSFRNGWNAGHSDMWMTGYIMGWLGALYEQDTGQFALVMDYEQ